MKATACPRPCPEFFFRPGTQDDQFFREVVLENQYRLPEVFHKDDLIIDIGAHIGTFVLACRGRGARRIVAYEPDQDNFKLLFQNSIHYIGVQQRMEAVWRSDGQDKLGWLSGYPQGLTGGASVVPGAVITPEQVCVPVVGLDDILVSVDRVRLLKIEAMGAEYPILYTSKMLSKVDEITGVIHPSGRVRELLNLAIDCNPDGLKKFLAGQGFSVWVAGRDRMYRGTKSTEYLFWAKKRGV